MEKVDYLIVVRGMWYSKADQQLDSIDLGLGLNVSVMLDAQCSLTVLR